MLDCWRTGGANSPETFIMAVAAILARYPDQVVYAVTNPAEGLPVQLTWMPSLKEVKDACEKEMEPIYRRERQEKLIADQLAERKQEEEARQSRPTREDMEAKYGKNWGLTSLDEPPKAARPAPSWEQVEEYYKARPGRIQWLADRLSVMRGEIPDTPEPK